MSRAKRMGLQGSSSAIYAVCEAERPLTIRGCFYRVMSLGHVPKTEDGYRQVQQRALKMRRNRSLPYEWISDGTRSAVGALTYSSADDALRSWSSWYRRALWDNQDVHVQLWVEKDAITSVIDGVTRELDVTIYSSRGFSSETFLYETAQDIIRAAKPAVIYQLGAMTPRGCPRGTGFR
ncbi:MAG: hypothetical protein WCB92_31795 [Mycobacterium sp.]